MFIERKGRFRCFARHDARLPLAEACAARCAFSTLRRRRHGIKMSRWMAPTPSDIDDIAIIFGDIPLSASFRDSRRLPIKLFSPIAAFFAGFH